MFKCKTIEPILTKDLAKNQQLLLEYIKQLKLELELKINELSN